MSNRLNFEVLLIKNSSGQLIMKVVQLVTQQVTYSHEGNKWLGEWSLTFFPKFSRPSWTKMSELSINTVENTDEIDQIILLTTCATKLHRYYRVTLHFLDFHQKIFPEIPLPLLLPPPFITFARVGLLEPY